MTLFKKKDREDYFELLTAPVKIGKIKKKDFIYASCEMQVRETRQFIFLIIN